MPKFEVSVTLTAESYITVEAQDEDSARKIVYALEANSRFTFPRFPPETVDTSDFDGVPDIRIDGVSVLEEKDAL